MSHLKESAAPQFKLYILCDRCDLLLEVAVISPLPIGWVERLGEKHFMHACPDCFSDLKRRKEQRERGTE